MSHIDLQAWVDKAEDSISPIFKNFLVRLKGLEGIPQECFTRHAEDRLQYPEDRLLEEIREFNAHTEGNVLFMGRR